MIIIIPTGNKLGILTVWNVANTRFTSDLINRMVQLQQYMGFHDLRYCIKNTCTLFQEMVGTSSPSCLKSYPDTRRTSTSIRWVRKIERMKLLYIFLNTSREAYYHGISAPAFYILLRGLCLCEQYFRFQREFISHSHASYICDLQLLSASHLLSPLYCLLLSIVCI